MARATKPDTTRRELSIQQLNAIDLLVTGQTDAEAADAVGVTRQTVNGWRHRDPWFQAALNRRRQEMWGSAVDALRALLPRAVAVLARTLNGPEDNPTVALAVLRLAGLDRSQAPEKLDRLQVGPTDADDIIDSAVRARRPSSNTALEDLLNGGPIAERERDDLLAQWGQALPGGGQG